MTKLRLCLFLIFVVSRLAHSQERPLERVFAEPPPAFGLCSSVGGVFDVREMPCEKSSQRLLIFPVFEITETLRAKDTNLAACLQNSSECALSKEPTGWMVGEAIGPENRIPSHGETTFKGRIAAPAGGDSKLADSIQKAFDQVRASSRVLEFVWRLGDQPSALDPLLRLQQVTKLRDNTNVASFGTCGELTVGAFAIGGTNHQIVSRCSARLRSSTHDASAVFAALTDPSEPAFDWVVSSLPTILPAGPIQISAGLFPVSPRKVRVQFPTAAIGRQVLAPSRDSTASTILHLEVTFERVLTSSIATSGSDSAKAGAPATISKQRLGGVMGAVALVMVIVALLVPASRVRVWIALRSLLRRLVPSEAAQSDASALTAESAVGAAERPSPAPRNASPDSPGAQAASAPSDLSPRDGDAASEGQVAGRLVSKVAAVDSGPPEAVGDLDKDPDSTHLARSAMPREQESALLGADGGLLPTGSPISSPASAQDREFYSALVLDLVDRLDQALKAIAELKLSNEALVRLATDQFERYGADALLLSNAMQQGHEGDVRVERRLETLEAHITGTVASLGAEARADLNRSESFLEHSLNETLAKTGAEITATIRSEHSDTEGMMSAALDRLKADVFEGFNTRIRSLEESLHALTAETVHDVLAFLSTTELGRSIGQSPMRELTQEKPSATMARPPRKREVKLPRLDKRAELTLRAAEKLVALASILYREWCELGSPREMLRNAPSGLPRELVEDLVIAFGNGVEDVVLGEGMHVMALLARTGTTEALPDSPLLMASVERLSSDEGWDAAALVYDWGRRHIPYLQTIIEAAPRELGSESSDGAGICRALQRASADLGGSYLDKDSRNAQIALEVVSKYFHDSVLSLYKSIGVSYFPIKLYQDDMHCQAAAAVLKHTRDAVEFGYSSLVLSKRIAKRGYIVRVRTPVIRAEDPSTDSGYRWEGAFSYVDQRNEKPDAS